MGDAPSPLRVWLRRAAVGAAAAAALRRAWRALCRPTSSRPTLLEACGPRGGRNVRILRVAARSKNVGPPDFAAPLSSWTLIPEGWTTVAEVLALPKTTLFAITHDDAIFVQDDWEKDIHKSEGNWPFLYEAQLNLAQRVFCVPIEVACAHADTMGGVPQGVLVSSTGRCGSTLLSQMLDRAEGVASISEPLALMSLLAQRDTEVVKTPTPIKKVAWDRALRMALRMQCKDFYSSGRTICIKTHSQLLSIVPDVCRIEPGVKHLYLYRNGHATVLSFCKLIVAFFRQMGAFGALLERMDQTPRGRRFSAKYLTPPSWRVLSSSHLTADQAWGTDPEFTAEHRFLPIVVMWAANLAQYTRFVKQGLPIRAVTYEQLLKDEAVVPKLFEYCGVAAADSPRARREALAHQSQDVGFTAKDKTSQVDVEFTAAQLAAYDSVCRRVGLPGVLRDTITLPNMLLSTKHG